jgi:adenylosuccinate lyase
LEIRDLQRSEVGEVAEPWGTDQHSSSTMPQKQNPEISEWLEGLARLARGYALALLDTQQQHERDISRLPAELHALPNLFLHAIAAVDSAEHILGNLRVFPGRMRSNVMMNGGLIMSESLMLLLAKRSRRKVWAHQLCHDIAMNVAANGGTLADAMAHNAEVARYLTAADIREATRPESYIGTAISQVNEATKLCASTKRSALHTLRRTVTGPASARRG